MRHCAFGGFRLLSMSPLPPARDPNLKASSPCDFVMSLRMQSSNKLLFRGLPDNDLIDLNGQPVPKRCKRG